MVLRKICKCRKYLFLTFSETNFFDGTVSKEASTNEGFHSSPGVDAGSVYWFSNHFFPRIYTSLFIELYGKFFF